jgi:hypothetical protein
LKLNYKRELNTKKSRKRRNPILSLTLSNLHTHAHTKKTNDQNYHFFVHGKTPKIKATKRNEMKRKANDTNNPNNNNTNNNNTTNSNNNSSANSSPKTPSTTPTIVTANNGSTKFQLSSESNASQTSNQTNSEITAPPPPPPPVAIAAAQMVAAANLANLANSANSLVLQEWQKNLINQLQQEHNLDPISAKNMLFNLYTNLTNQQQPLQPAQNMFMSNNQLQLYSTLLTPVSATSSNKQQLPLGGTTNFHTNMAAAAAATAAATQASADLLTYSGNDAKKRTETQTLASVLSKSSPSNIYSTTQNKMINISDHEMMIGEKSGGILILTYKNRKIYQIY